MTAKEEQQFQLELAKEIMEVIGSCLYEGDYEETSHKGRKCLKIKSELASKMNAWTFRELQLAMIENFCHDFNFVVMKRSPEESFFIIYLPFRS